MGKARWHGIKTNAVAGCVFWSSATAVQCSAGATGSPRQNLERLFDFSQCLAAGAGARLIGNCVAAALRATAADIHAFEVDALDDLAAAAFAGVGGVQFARAAVAASAKNRFIAFDFQDMARSERLAAGAVSRFGGNRAATVPAAGARIEGAHRAFAGFFRREIARDEQQQTEEKGWQQ